MNLADPDWSVELVKYSVNLYVPEGVLVLVVTLKL